MNSSRYSELWVCFKPIQESPPSCALVLSFLDPVHETKLEEIIGPRLLKGRDVCQKIRKQARETYLKIISEAPAAPCFQGKTLRSLLQGHDEISHWWYHQLSAKQTVTPDSTYHALLQTFSIKSVAEEHNIQVVRLFYVRRSIAASLKKSYRILLHHPVSYPGPIDIFIVLLRSAASRIFFIFSNIFLIILLNLFTRKPKRQFDVALQGYWDWSVTPALDDTLKDRYFVDLPDRLREKEISVCWLALFSPRSEKWQRGRSLRKVAVASDKFPEIVLIQSYLRVFDVFKASNFFKYFFIWLKCVKSREFKKQYVRNNLDCYPLFRKSFLKPFISKGISEYVLAYIAAKRACHSIRPKILITFLEFFLSSRALYAAAKAVNSKTILLTAQHASYCMEKCFGIFDPVLEMQGVPDNCKIPAPEKIFAMGELSRRYWLKSGYADDQIFLTGGLRFQHIGSKEIKPISQRERKNRLTVLLIFGMNEILDFDMCAAVCAAVKNAPGIRLKVRNHPSYMITGRKEFSQYLNAVEISQNTVGDDLTSADLIIFTHSSLPDEAFIIGVPVWQWIGATFDTSTFSELPIIPRFSSIRELKAALKEFVASPDKFIPSMDVRKLVQRDFFGKYPAETSHRISEEINTLLKMESYG